MRLDFFDRRSAERFAELLDENDGSRGQHARGPGDDQFAEPVAIAHSLSAAHPGVQVDPEFRLGLRAMLVAAAERDGIGATAVSHEEADAPAPVRKLFGRTGRRLRARGVIIIGVAASAMAVSGISAASESAAPGDALYGVKRSTERAQLAMAGSDITRGQLSLTFARNRLSEAAAMSGDDVKFRDALDDMDADTKQGVKLLTSAAVARREMTALDSVESFTGGQRRLLTPALDRLGPVNQERAGKSLTLLDAVDKRAVNLRERVACAAGPAAGGNDALGPKLSPCEPAGEEQPSATTEKQQGGRDDNSKSSGGASPATKDRKKDDVDEPAAEEPTAEPGSSSKAATSDSDTGSDGSDDAGDADQPTIDKTSDASTTSSEDSPEPVVSVDPANPPTDAEKGVLGGLLGGLFGNN